MKKIKLRGLGEPSLSQGNMYLKNLNICMLGTKWTAYLQVGHRLTWHDQVHLVQAGPLGPGHIRVLPC